MGTGMRIVVSADERCPPSRKPFWDDSRNRTGLELNELRPLVFHCDDRDANHVRGMTFERPDPASDEEDLCVFMLTLRRRKSSVCGKK
jgi:hypothetical protein